VSPRETLPYLDFISFSRSCGKSFTLALQSPTDHHQWERQIAFFTWTTSKQSRDRKCKRKETLTRSCGTNSSSRDRKSCKEAIAENNALLEGQIVPVSNGNDLT